MNEIRVLVAEDESGQRKELIAWLSELWPSARVVAECWTGSEAIQALVDEQPQVAFLDIRMPGADGIEVAAHASGKAHVVFTTAYEHYALQAFDQGAVDYLLKPIERERLMATIQRLEERLSLDAPRIDETLAEIRRQLFSSEEQERLRWITASVGDSVRFFDVNDVIFFQASGKYVRVVTEEGEGLVRMSLKELRQRLDPENFWQVHRSTIVAVSSIREVSRDELGHLTLFLRDSEEVLSVSAQFRHLFRGM